MAGACLFTISTDCAFADSLAAGIIRRFGADPLTLARGRVLLPNNRAVRSLTEAFVRLSGGGLLLPRLVPIGDPDLEERIGSALDPIGDADEVPPAIDPLKRLFMLAGFLKRGGRSTVEALKLASDLSVTLDAMLVEEIDPARLSDLFAERDDHAEHWKRSLAELEAIVSYWPAILAAEGVVDLAQRRGLLLDRLAQRWTEVPPPGFTIAAGINTAAPAVARLLSVIALMNGGEVVLPGLWLSNLMPDEEWDALDHSTVHPQHHLKLLLDRMGFKRDEVNVWPDRAGGGAPRGTECAIANALAAPSFSQKWITLDTRERRLPHVRLAEFAGPAEEAQGIALALRHALEEEGRTAALVTPDRALAARVVALLRRWGITADDSAGTKLSASPPGRLLLAAAAASAEHLAPIALLALLKHPLVGGEGVERRIWLDRVRALDLAFRGPRPPAGLDGLDAAFTKGAAAEAWAAIRPLVAPLDGLLDQPGRLGDLMESLVKVVGALSQDRAFTGQDGRALAEFISSLAEVPNAADMVIEPEEAVPLLANLLDRQVLRPAYGGHPRIAIWGLLEARLQRADLMILGGLNNGTWPALPSPDPWLPPQARRQLGMPTLDTRVGLSAQDFAGALGAPEALVTRARRDSRSPTVASRFWLRLKALDPEIAMDQAIPGLASALDRPDTVRAAKRPAPAPEAALRPTRIAVTDVDRLKADPFDFYAKQILSLRALDPLDAEPSAAWRGTAVHDVLEQWLKQDNCDPDSLQPRIAAMLSGDAVHPLLRALWRPRLEEAARWIAENVTADRALGRRPDKAEEKGEARIAGVQLHGKADRLDVLAAGGCAIVDYKTGQAPDGTAIRAGFALQLGLLGLIAKTGGFGDEFRSPESFEYWSLARDKNKKTAGYRRDAAAALKGEDFLAMVQKVFAEAAGKWLTGTEPFKAKLNPAYAPFGDYDQLMRLAEWYGAQE